MLDLDKLTDAMVSHTMKAIDAATAPLLARIEALEARVKGLGDFDPESHMADLSARLDAAEARAKAHADAAMQKALDAIPAPVEPPETPELPDIAAMVSEAVEAAVKAIPQPQDGKDGASVTVDDVMPALEKRVEDFLAAIPMPKDGRDGIDGKDGARGEKGEAGRDGAGIADLLLDINGHLIATMTDGRVKALGRVVGKDGKPGRDGADGKDGRDGLGFEDLTFDTDEHGRVVAKFQRGDLVKSFRLPGIVDRGVFKSDETYLRGDAVTWAGSLWIAQEDGVKGKPEAGSGWRLAVKKGRDARGA